MTSLGVTLEPPVRHFACPTCSTTISTRDAHPLSTPRMHGCAQLGGLTVPLEELDSPSDTPVARHLVIPREDYAGPSGAPAMAVHLERPDGSFDCNVFADVADLDMKVIDLSWSVSGVFAYNVEQSLLKTLNWSTDALKCALFNNTGTPDKTVTTAALTEYNGASSQWVTANEVSQSGQWAAGGVALSSVAVAQNVNSQGNNVVALTAANPSSGSAATLSNVYGCLVYDTTVSSQGLCFNYFGGANSVTAGTFTVVWNANGIATFTS